MKNNKIYDTIIIGSGSAGMTAGIYAARRMMKALIIGKELGGQIIWASEIENYPGFKSINNFELIAKMQEQVSSLGVEIVNEEVIKINETDQNGLFSVITHNNQFLTKTIILAMGLSPRKLSIPGEEKLIGKGVSYCATCDGPLYKNKTVAVIGGGNAALDAAELLSNISQKVYLIYRGDKFRAFESLTEKVSNKDNITILKQNNIEEIIGDKKVEKIKVVDKNDGSVREILIDGLFIEIGRIASSELANGLVSQDEKNQIKIDEKCRTSQEGIFAAGDITNSPFKQIIIACGQGAVAALTAYEYLQLRKN